MSDVAIVEHTLPHNLEAERAICGTILVHNEAFHVVAEAVNEDDFYRDAHRRIFRHMVALSDRNQAIDFVTLKNALATSNELDAVGGPAYITSLADGVPRTTNVEYYAQIVKEKAILRRLIFACNETLASAYDSSESAAEILDAAEGKLFKIAEHRDQRRFIRMDDVVRKNFSRIEQVFDQKRLVSGVETGFTDLDEITRGLQPGNLILIGARPSIGKTSLALNIAQHAGVDQHVGFFSLEMSEEELFMRMLSSEAQIDSHRIMSGALGQKDYARISAALETLSALRVHIDDTANVNLREVRSKAMRLKREHGLHLLVVDYIQLMASSSIRYENRTVEVGNLSRGLKALAKELHVPVVALVQLSRNPESRSDHRPQLSDLRESGNLEQDADVVILVYREDVYSHDPNHPDAGIAELIIAKQRNGPTGVVRLCFLREQTRFANLAQGA